MSQTWLNFNFISIVELITTRLSVNEKFRDLNKKFRHI